jgi:FkbM family methyltransferase
MYKLLDLKRQIEAHNMKVRGIIQIGASMGEEIDMFEECGIEKVIYIDADPLSMPELRRKLNYTDNAYCQLMWNKDGEVIRFNITDFLACSSANPIIGDLPVLRTIDQESMTLNTFMRVNEFNQADYNMLYMDCEGSELRVLAGANLANFDYIYTEWQTDYPNTPEALIAALPEFDEVVRITQDHKDGLSQWGDSLFIRHL